MASGRSSRASLLSAKYIASKAPLRAAVVVSKKVAKKAVDRNRLRRAVYRALASVSGTGDIVVFVQKVPQGHLAPAFSEELVLLLQKYI